MYSSVKKWVHSWYRKQEILSIRCSSYRLCAIWEFRGGQPIRWLSLSAVSGSNWNLEYSTWFLWREENMRTCRKNFRARTIAFMNQTHWGHSSGTGEHPHLCTIPKWMLLFVSWTFLSAHFKTRTYFCYLIILLWLQINESLSLCFAYVSNQNILKKFSKSIPFFSCYTITYKLNFDKLMIVYLFNTQKWIFVRRVNLISDNSAIMQLCCV